MNKSHTSSTRQNMRHTVRTRALGASLFISAWATGAAWADTQPSAIQCQITGVPMQFESIDPLTSAPQPGEGHILVTCTNDSQQLQEVDLSVYDGKSQQRQLAHSRYKQEAVMLSLFVDPERQRRLANNAQAPQALRLRTQLSPNSSVELTLPFFALIKLSRLVPAGVYARPLDLDLSYQTRVVQPAATPALLRTAALASTATEH